MQQILFAMLAAGLVLALWSMAKVFSEEKERAWMQEMPQDRMLWLKAEAFGALSRAIGQEEDTKPDADRESERIWAGFRQKACADCGYRKNCDRVGRIHRKACASRMIALLEDNREEDYEKSIADWVCWCSRGRDTMQTLRFCVQEHHREQFWREKLTEVRLVTAMQLGEIAHMLRQSARESSRYQPLGQAMEKQLKAAARHQGVQIGEIWVLERDTRRISFFVTMKACGKKAVSVQEITRILEKRSGRHMTADPRQKAFVGENYALYSFTETVRFEILCGISRRPGSRQTVCGDNYSIFTENGQAHLCLSDGMGCGDGAKKSSEQLLNLLEEFMACGFSKEMTFQMLHTTLLLQAEENERYATLDICQVNLYTGICEFMKAGAAASYIIRNRHVQPVELPAMAPGLEKKTGYEKLRVRLRPGDYIVMITDGVCDALKNSQETKSMETMLEDLKKQSPQRMSEEILAKVSLQQNDENKDDMTVLVAGFWEKQG